MLTIKTLPREMNLKPDLTVSEARAEYMAAMEHLDTTAKKAKTAMQQYEAAQYRASLARQELWDRERDITSTLHSKTV